MVRGVLGVHWGRSLPSSAGTKGWKGWGGWEEGFKGCIGSGFHFPLQVREG